MDGAIFSKVKLLYEVIKNGIMDYLVSGDDSENMFFGHADQIQVNSFTMNNLNNFFSSPSKQNEQDGEKEPVEESDWEEKAAQLDWDKIKPADRVTFLLNYLYLVLRNNQLLASSLPRDLGLLREIFVACVDPYVLLLSDWVSKGELNDPKNEFFIKVNPKLQDESQEETTQMTAKQ